MRPPATPQMPDRYLEPALGPAHPLVPQAHHGRRGQLARVQLRIRGDAPARLDDAHARVDVLREHRAAHPGATQQLRPPVAVAAAEDPEGMQPGASGVADRVDGLELHRDRPGHQGHIAVAHDAVPLDHVELVAEPVPGPAERVARRLVVGIEHAHELAAHVGDGGIDVLGLRRAALDLENLDARLARRQLSQHRLDLQRLGGVVGEDHLEVGRVVDAQERLERVEDRGGLVGQVRGDDRRRGREGTGRGLRHPDGIEREEALRPDHHAGQQQGDRDDHVGVVRQRHAQRLGGDVHREGKHHPQEQRDGELQPRPRSPGLRRRGWPARVIERRRPDGRPEVEGVMCHDGRLARTADQVVGRDGVAVERDHPHGRGHVNSGDPRNEGPAGDLLGEVLQPVDGHLAAQLRLEDEQAVRAVPPDEAVCADGARRHPGQVAQQLVHRLTAELLDDAIALRDLDDADDARAAAGLGCERLLGDLGHEGVPAEESGPRAAQHVRRRASAREAALDGGEQSVDLERLEDVVVGPQRQPVDHVVPVHRCSAEEQHRNARRPVAGPEPDDQLEAGQSRHLHVGDHQVGDRVVDGVEGGVAVVDDRHPIARTLERLAHQQPHDRIVVDHQDRRLTRSGGCHATSLGIAAGEDGSSTRSP